MTHFVEHPKIQSIGKSRKTDQFRRVLAPWRCWWTYKGHHRILDVPEGYIYDGMSVPRWAWTPSGLYPGGRSDAAALPHDALYRAAGGDKPDGWGRCVLSSTGPLVSRKETDWLLAEFMKDVGYWAPQRAIAYSAVRIGGAKHWGGPSPSGVYEG